MMRNSSVLSCIQSNSTGQGNLTICRLRIGHCRFNVHLYKIGVISKVFGLQLPSSPRNRVSFYTFMFLMQYSTLDHRKQNIATGHFHYSLLYSNQTKADIQRTYKLHLGYFRGKEGNLYCQHSVGTKKILK